MSGRGREGRISAIFRTTPRISRGHSPRIVQGAAIWCIIHVGDFTPRRVNARVSLSYGPEMNYRFSGHETFPCRFAWLPKAYAAVSEAPDALQDDSRAMVVLGVGKNMVRAIRFWMGASGIALPGKDGSFAVTPFGRAIFDRTGFDPFLEDLRTLWLVHWQLSSNVPEPLFAWDYLLNRWPHPEFCRSDVLASFSREAERIDRKLSTVTLEQHFDTFLHTYVPTRGKKGDFPEDSLDCPLVELELIQQVGDRRLDGSGRREPIYAFRRDPKPEVTADLFAYCINDFWSRRRASEKTLSLRDVAIAHGSPGQVFKLSEADIRDRLATIEADSRGAFCFRESAALQHITRSEDASSDMLPAVFGHGAS